MIRSGIRLKRAMLVFSNPDGVRKCFASCGYAYSLRRNNTFPDYTKDDIEKIVDRIMTRNDNNNDKELDAYLYLKKENNDLTNLSKIWKNEMINKPWYKYLRIFEGNYEYPHGIIYNGPNNYDKYSNLNEFKIVMDEIYFYTFIA